MTQEEIDAKVAEFMAESVVVDSMNEAYVYNAMNALRDVAENYYRWGMEDAQEQMMKDAVEREVKVDAGGYPYIDATELYDYDEDKPLAKEGDKVKVLIIKKE